MFTVETRRLIVLLVFGISFGGTLCTATDINELEMNGLRLTSYTWYWSQTTLVVQGEVMNISSQDKEDVRLYITGNLASPWGKLEYVGNGRWEKEDTLYTGDTLLAIVGGPKAVPPSGQEINVAPGEPPDASYPYVKIGDLAAGEEKPIEFKVRFLVLGTSSLNSPYQQWITLAEGGERLPHKNRPPTAYGESITTTVDTPVEITLHATDPDRDDLSFHVSKNPTHGTLAGTPPNVTYTPNSGYVGADSFVFIAKDKKSESNMAIISITVGGDTPGWTTLDYPGARETQLIDINGDYIIGWSRDPTHSLLYNIATETWTTLAAPGSDWTWVFGIDDDNIVGSTGDATDHHGFVYNITTKVWSTFDVPGADWTTATGIDGGNIVGTYYGAYDYHIFIYDGTTWTTVDYPGEDTAFPRGIDGDIIVGHYDWGPALHDSFIYEITTHTWTTLEAPGSNYTRAEGIDGSNIVGWYDDIDGYHGFLFDGTTWTTLDAPMQGLLDTEAYGIDGANIVGCYSDADMNYHGFLYSP